MRVLPTGTPGAIAVTLTPRKTGLLELVVKRDGPWMSVPGSTECPAEGPCEGVKLAQSAMVSADNQPSRG